MSYSTPIKHDGRAVLFTVAEFFVNFTKRQINYLLHARTVLTTWMSSVCW